MTKEERCERMRRGKAAKRMALGAAPELTECGWAFFGGPAFCGCHAVRVLARQDVTRVAYLEVDGALTCAKTQRGVRALLMRRIGKAVERGL